jgi:hypothetical protein
MHDIVLLLSSVIEEVRRAYFWGWSHFLSVYEAVVVLQAINEKPNVIQEYESGRAIPNPQILQKMSRVLGVPLSKTGGGGKQPAKPAAAKPAAPAAKKKKNPQF